VFTLPICPVNNPSAYLDASASERTILVSGTPPAYPLTLSVEELSPGAATASGSINLPKYN